MNFRLDIELILKRHASMVMVTLLAFVVLGAFCAYGLELGDKANFSDSAAEAHRRKLDEHFRTFQAVLIPQGELESKQQLVISTALNLGLQPGRIEYGIGPPLPGHQRIATLQLPLRGSYRGFRSFLSAMLEQLPALAVEGMSIQREAKGDEVTVHLRLALYVDAEEAGR